MKITIDLNYEDVRKLIESKVSNEASKHGYPGDISKIVLVSFADGRPLNLGELQMSVHAEIEVP